MFRFKPGAERERGDLAPRAAERGAGEPGKEGSSHKTGVRAAKHFQALDNPLEIFVICAQGVCSFFRSPQRRRQNQGEREKHCKGLEPSPCLRYQIYCSALEIESKSSSWHLKLPLKNQDIEGT